MRVAILDDDEEWVDYVVFSLTKLNYTCFKFFEGKAFKRALQRESYDLILMDWRIPDLSGELILRWIRERESEIRVPIIFVASRSDEIGIAQILNAGADDYIVKPAGEILLQARISSLLRRSYQTGSNPLSQSFGHYRFDLAHRSLYFKDEAIALTQKEFDLIHLFFRRINQPISRDYIRDRIWNQSDNIPSRTIDTHISVIRTKAKLHAQNGYKLISIYGYGYRLESA
ncbi:response regulator transcription factor [Burkholderia sp. Ac-20384]|uniref:response regulator transcription factor n=1 Tax=Burkholderia sp. Ac-20384 TaxID=2703902 RepID=UPI00198220F6|nr:response regulator transcription factor [Burkholderia sp. Ac-20384]MBN3823787.1 response regulator transcription factor [Burkholderia sp. Ac-20384]